MPRAKPRSFTSKSQGLRNTLYSQVLISNAINSTSENANPTEHNANRYNAIWDTGATGTVITQKVVDDCALSPTGVVEVQTAAGKTKVNSYLAHVWLPNKIVVSDVFAVTNKDEKTVFSFRIPSVEHIDFVKNPFIPKPTRIIPKKRKRH